MPDEIKMPATETKPEPKAPKGKPTAKPAPAPVAAAEVEVDSADTEIDTSKYAVRVVRNIKTNGNKGRLLFGRKGLYFDGEAELLWREHRSHVELFPRG